MAMRRRSHRLLAVMLAAVLAACSSTTKEEKAGGKKSADETALSTVESASDSTTTPPEAADATAQPPDPAKPAGRAKAGKTTAAAPSGAGGAAAPGGSSSVDGSTLPPIRLGYVVVDLSGASALTGNPAIGGYSESGANERGHKEMQALVNWANRNGGVGGRKIEAQGYEIPVAAPRAEKDAWCVRITQDAKREVLLDPFVFLAERDWSCFAQRKTTFIGFITAPDDEYLKTVSPYVYTTWDSHDRSARMLVDGLNSVDYFKNATVGVVIVDDPTSARVYERHTRPALQQIGVRPKVVVRMTNDASQQGAQASNAVLQLKTEGVTHVIFEHGLLAYLAFSNAAKSQGYQPRYGFGDYQSATANAGFYGDPQQQVNAVGVSASYVNIAPDNSRQTTDINAPYRKGKEMPGLERCLALLTAELKVNYYDPGTSGASINWRYYCDMFFLWLEAARNVGPTINSDSFVNGVIGIGSSYLSTFMEKEEFPGGRADGAASYATGIYDERCRCFVQRGSWRPMP